MIDTQKAVHLVEERGSALEKARMGRLLFNVQPEAEAINPFLDLQNQDGGFPIKWVAGNPSCVHVTLAALNWLDDLGLLEAPPGERALGYLRDVQEEYGAWDEQLFVAMYGVPDWARPGDLEARLYLTSLAAYWLGVSGSRNSPAFREALGFLLAHQRTSGKFPGFWHTTWLATSVFVIAGKPYELGVNMGLRALTSREWQEWVDSQLCWALDCLCRVGLPPTTPFLESGLSELESRQREDGSWSMEDRTTPSIGVTWEALKVFKRFSLV